MKNFVAFIVGVGISVYLSMSGASTIIEWALIGLGFVVVSSLPALFNQSISFSLPVGNAKRLRGAEKKSDSKATWSELPRVDYENYELPTYLRRGYDRRAL